MPRMLILGLQHKRASTRQALGALVSVLGVAVLADRVAAATLANVDDGCGKHRLTSGLIPKLATVS